MTNEEKYKTAEKREKAFNAFCAQEGNTCEKCPLRNDILTSCRYKWLELEAKEEMPLPCPCCGGKSMLYTDREFGASWVKCTICGLSTPTICSSVEAVARWNRRPK